MTAFFKSGICGQILQTVTPTGQAVQQGGIQVIKC